MKKSVLILISFTWLTIIGTLMHEVGHLIPAKLLGYKTTLHYGSMNWENRSLKYANELMRKYSNINNIPNSELSKLNELKAKHKKDSLLISLGGPIQTISTGLLGIIMLFIRRKSLNRLPFGIINWIAVFLTLFWSRQLYNLLNGIANHIFNNSNSIFGGDEARISKLLGLPTGTIGLITGVLGLIICTTVIFRVIPKKDIPTFIISGIVGSAIGYITWFKWLGPILLP